MTTTASALNLEFVSQLDAERVIDYRAVRFEESVSGMDVVFDTVGGETLKRSWGVLKPGGRMITIAADSETTTDNRVKQAFFIVEPNHEQLIHIGDLLESSDLHPVVDAVLPLTRASAAYTGEVRERRGAASWSLRSHKFHRMRDASRKNPKGGVCMSIKKILWASDGSEESLDALRWVEVLATRYDANVLALSVFETANLNPSAIADDLRK